MIYENTMRLNVIEKKNDTFIKTILFIGPLFILFFLDFFNLNQNGILGYVDEIIGVYYLGYICLNIIIHNNIKLLKWVSVLLLFVLIGLLGNVFINVQQLSMYWLLLDIFFFIKPYIFLMASITFCKNYNSKRLINNLANISKLFIVAIFIGAIFQCAKYKFNINDIMTIDRYHFVTGHCVTLSKYLTLFILPIIISDSKHKKLYFLLGFLSTLVTTSGAGILSYFLIYVFCFMYKKYKLQWYHLAIVGVLAILVGWNEISGYLLNDSAARSIMYKYAFITANNYFPIGSGFGTYNSYAAAHNYSSLYIQYGFNNIWGLEPTALGSGHCFLFDTYYPMLIGQFGWIGIGIYIYILSYIFIKLFQSKKYKTISFMLCMMVVAFGFNITDPVSCLLFVMGGILYTTETKKIEKSINK